MFTIKLKALYKALYTCSHVDHTEFRYLQVLHTCLKAASVNVMNTSPTMMDMLSTNSKCCIFLRYFVPTGHHRFENKLLFLNYCFNGVYFFVNKTRNQLNTYCRVLQCYVFVPWFKRQ